MELVPQLLGLQAAGDFGHLLAGDDGGGGDEGLGAQGGRAAAEIPVGVQAGQVAQRLGAGGFLNELLCGGRGGRDGEGGRSAADADKELFPTEKPFMARLGPLRAHTAALLIKTGVVIWGDVPQPRIHPCTPQKPAGKSQPREAGQYRRELGGEPAPRTAAQKFNIFAQISSLQ